MKTICIIILLSLSCSIGYAQESKTKKVFAIDYKIVLPRLDTTFYENDFVEYHKYITRKMINTQMSMSSTEKNIITEVTPNSILPHAVLDTNTIIKNIADLKGKWRMLNFRLIKFTDSMDLKNKKNYRLETELIEENPLDEGIAEFTNKQYKLNIKTKESDHFIKAASCKYSIENRRYIMMYKLLKGNSGISEIGIDENGYLIINYPSVTKKLNTDNGCMTYITTITQYIFEKIVEN